MTILRSLKVLEVLSMVITGDLMNHVLFEDLLANQLKIYWLQFLFKNGDSKEKSLILKSLGYNLTLQGKKIQFSIQKPFYLVRKTYEKVSAELEKVEPNKKIGSPINHSSVPAISSIVSGR